MNKKCPECDVPMQKIDTSSHYGVPIELDQCEKCGGLWFENLELFRTHPEEALKIDNIDIEKFREDSFLENSKLICPSDHSELNLFTDPNFPKSLKVESCQECGGFWFNRGEFSKFKTEREYKKNQNSEAIKKENDDEFEKSISAMLSNYSESGKYDSINNVSQFLATPINSYNLKSLNGGKSGNDRKAEETASVIMMIIQILFRLFLRR